MKFVFNNFLCVVELTRSAEPHRVRSLVVRRTAVASRLEGRTRLMGQLELTSG